MATAINLQCWFNSISFRLGMEIQNQFWSLKNRVRRPSLYSIAGWLGIHCFEHEKYAIMRPGMHKNSLKLAQTQFLFLSSDLCALAQRIHIVSFSHLFEPKISWLLYVVVVDLLATTYRYWQLPTLHIISGEADGSIAQECKHID